MIFIIKGPLPSLNEYINAERSNKYLGAKIKKEATELVAWQVKALQPILRPSHYTFTWTVKDKRKDPDNVSYACKFIFDGLQMAGILDNDSFKNVLSITHKFSVGDPKVVVQVDPVNS